MNVIYLAFIIFIYSEFPNMSTDEYSVPNDIYFGVNYYARQENVGFQIEEARSQKFREPSLIIRLRILTIFCDTMLMGCGISFCIAGCLTLTKYFDVVKVLNIQQHLGEAFTILGCIYCILAILGILGAGRHKACLLTMHNIGLLLILCANGMAMYLYLRYIYVYTKKEIPEMFKLFPGIKSFLETFDGYYFTSVQCCCNSIDGNRCWFHNGIPVNEDSCKVNLYQKIENFMQIGLYFLSTSMAIQALAMTFGYFVVSCKNRYNRTSLKEALKD